MKGSVESIFELLKAGLHPDYVPQIADGAGWAGGSVDKVAGFAERATGSAGDGGVHKIGIDETVWQAIYRLATAQGVVAIVWDGVQKLAPELQPERALRLQWALQSEHLEKKYTLQHKVAGELARLFGAQDIRMLVLKGLGIGAYYARPDHRECGDIDLFLFGELKRGNDLLRKAGATVFAAVPKHTELAWRGVTIENHSTFLNVRRNRTERQLDALLCEILAREGTRPLGNGIETPAATFNAIYLVIHAALHFIKAEVALRHLCDWGYFMQHNAHAVDAELFRTTLDRYGMGRFAALMSDAANRFCGFECPPIAKWTYSETERELFVETIFACRAMEASAHGTGSKAVTRTFYRAVEKLRAPYRNRRRLRLLGISPWQYYRDTIRAQWHERFTLFNK